MTADREIRCRRTVIGHDDGGRERPEQCAWRGTIYQFPDHTAETADADGGPHEQCVVCRQSLADDETQTCARCVKRLDDDLAEILDLYATLPAIIERGALHTGRLPGGNALVLLADGSIDGGGPDDHIRYHDPVLVLATLHDLWETEWRDLFQQPHFARWQATVATTVGYLRKYLRTAARQHPAFGDFAADVHTLRQQLARTAGRSDDPANANADCTRCGGRLRRSYRLVGRDEEAHEDQLYARFVKAEAAIDELWHRAMAQRDAERSYDLPESKLTPLPTPVQERHASEPVMRGHKTEGLADTAVCADCGHEYTSGEYRIALRLKALANASGWITPAAAANLLEKPAQTVWTWVRRLQIPVACRVEDRRLVVDAEAIKRKGKFQSQRDGNACG